MKLHTLQPAKGSVKNRKRIGRGTGSGRGGTSTRGHKGAQSRSGYSRKLGFEGGQMPLQRRVPKFGFKSLNRIECKPINLDVLQSVAEKLNTDTVTFDTLVENGLVSKKDVVKVLGRGELTAKLNVSAHYFSASATETIEKLGGTVNKI
ncbi:50S ribosomal protein L15 [Echinicola sp. CAU 1574]|uniref:Large ribosomal subunit protein uL15 n=1 Tax=Echinicola arenosa TaxID=2774144 RepID=A0ABR9ANA5_9BACT|nr:50S ribosomal protein L15 [Echinicola arenosa]MBD8490274.1 50S ribosomal protein L15 [Echinicola arenosa]